MTKCNYKTRRNTNSLVSSNEHYQNIVDRVLPPEKSDKDIKKSRSTPLYDMNKEFEFLNLKNNKPAKKIIVLYKYKMFCDGGSRNSSRNAAIGIIVYDKDNHIVVSHAECIGSASCNVAEYIALYTGLMLLKDQGIKEVNIYMDSDLIVHQINGLWKCKHPNMDLLCSKTKLLLKKFKWTLSWIPREKNKEADSLVNQAFCEKE